MKVKIFTFGCTANQDNSSILASILKKHGYELTNSNEDAEVFIVNSCIVKGATQSKVINLIRKLKQINKEIILTGCMPLANYKLAKSFNVKLLCHNSLDKICELLQDKKQEIITRKNSSKLGYEKESNIIQIAEGCLGDCSYCATKLAKGQLYSFPEDKILQEVKKLAKIHNTIRITATDCGCYGLDIGTNLPSLIKKIISLPENFKIRIGMINPKYAKIFLNELIEIYKHEKVIKFLHIPVQSGSDKVLKLMKRQYKVRDFIEIVKKFRKEIPEICISTDIIVGFPNESDKDFDQTIELVKKTKPDILNISKFSPMPGTEAAKLKKLPSQIVKERSKRLYELFVELKNGKA